jgi:hypothetical protein
MIIEVLAAWIPALLIAFSGVMKLTGGSAVIETLTKLGVERYVRLLGVTEIGGESRPDDSG